MVAKIITFLRNLNFTDVPESKLRPVYYPPIYRRSFVFGCYVYLIGILLQILFIIFFLITGLHYLTLFNILIALVWVVVYLFQRGGLFTQGYVLSMLAIISHATVCVATIGWQSGFQYYLIIPPVLLFLVPWSTTFKGIVASVYYLVYLTLFILSSKIAPQVQLGQYALIVFYQFNILAISVLLALAAFFYYKIAQKSEKKIYKEHKNTVIALKDRDQALKRLKDELSEATEYVRKILPHPIVDGSIRTNWRFIPSTSLGGDAFGYHKVDQDHFAVYLIDVSGHGVGAALLSASVINVVRSQSLPKTDFKDPVQVLKALNLAFPSDANKDMFFTIWYGVFNINSRELTYASAGHPPAILCDETSSCDCQINLLKTPNFVVGGMDGTDYVKDKCKILDGNTLYIFSDGVYEVEKPDGTNWHFNEFVNFIKKVKTDGQAVMDRLYDYVRRKGKSDNLEDDFTIVEVVFG
jgi:sigma-B regulation protein RsbU (phosphoserine phosphatase)